MEPRHERAGPHAEVTGQAAHGAQRWRQPRHRFEEEPRLDRDVSQGRDEPRQDAGGDRRRRVPDEIPEPAPSVGVRAVHGRPHARRAQAQQRLGDLAVVTGYQGDGGDGRELAHEPRDGGERLAAAPVHRDHHRVHPPRAGKVERLAQRFSVQRVEATVARRVDPRALGRRQDRADRDHARLR